MRLAKLVEYFPVLTDLVRCRQRGQPIGGHGVYLGKRSAQLCREHLPCVGELLVAQDLASDCLTLDRRQDHERTPQR